MQNYPQSRLILADAITVFIAWAAILAGGALFVVSLTSAWRPEMLATVVGITLVGAVVLHVVLAYLHACPSCGKHPTVQGFSPPHERAPSIGGMDGWASVVWSVVICCKFVCIHCGARYRVAA